MRSLQIWSSFIVYFFFCDLLNLRVSLCTIICCVMGQTHIVICLIMFLHIFQGLVWYSLIKILWVEMKLLLAYIARGLESSGIPCWVQLNDFYNVYLCFILSNSLGLGRIRINTFFFCSCLTEILVRIFAFRAQFK